MTTAFVFPGQGSQTVGMGRALSDNFAVARDVFAEVDDALSQNLSTLIFEGPADDLTLTTNTQPALMAVSIAAARVLEAEKGLNVSSLSCVAGHSLGEYAALCLANSISLSDTAKLLRIRGDAMQDAVPVGKGAMAALIGANVESAQAVLDATDGGIGEIANDNAPGQIVISGSKERIEAACAVAKEHGIKMAKLLPVSAPFHCSMMQPAADRMEEALSAMRVSAPTVPVIANVTAAKVTDPDEIKKLLVEQVTGQVRWTQSVQAMIGDGVDRFIEIGAGKVLSGLIRRIDKQANVSNMASPEDLAAF